MILTVRIASWQLEDDHWVVAVGDQISSWLSFDEVERWPGPAARINVISGVARSLPGWPGAEFGRHPVRLDLEGAALYWDAPRPIAGPIEVEGTVSVNTVDAPDGFPVTQGVVRGVRMEWQDFGHDGQGRWSPADSQAGYEHVATSYLPRHHAIWDAGVAPGARATQWTGVLLDLEIS